MTDTSPSHWLFCWNPRKGEWTDLAEDIQRTRQGATVVHKRRCASQKISVGDKAWLIRVGESPKGIMGLGHIVSEPYESFSSDEISGDVTKEKSRRYVDIEYIRILDLFEENFITEKDLAAITIDNQQWWPQASGIEIKKRSAEELEKLWDQLSNLSPSKPMTEDISEVAEATNLILYGPPGTGKTYELNRKKAEYTSAVNAQTRYEFVTFHQAYSYEDFVEGIRPVQDEESGELVYRVVPGVFRRICQRAQNDAANRYAIFIDEINRGNIAKIFGELITLIEQDKRATYKPDGSLAAGLSITLPYSGDAFTVPKNLDIYGTMNTADRSIALLDTALRRRFRFQEMMPDAGVIRGSRGDGYIEDGEGGVINLRALLEAMNKRLRFLLNRDLMLGHAYLCKVRDFAALKDVLLNQLVPLLQEYFYDDWRRIQLVLRDADAENQPLHPQIIIHETRSNVDVLGFDHDDFEDMIDYRVARIEDISPDAVRKIYKRTGG